MFGGGSQPIPINPAKVCHRAAATPCQVSTYVAPAAHCKPSVTYAKHSGAHDMRAVMNACHALPCVQKVPPSSQVEKKYKEIPAEKEIPAASYTSSSNANICCSTEEKTAVLLYMLSSDANCCRSHGCVSASAADGRLHKEWGREGGSIDLPRASCPKIHKRYSTRRCSSKRGKCTGSTCVVCNPHSPVHVHLPE